MTGTTRLLALFLTGTALVTAGMSCDDTTTEVAEHYNQCDLGVIACASTGGGRTCKYNLPNRHYHWNILPFRGERITFTAFVFTDWCYARGYITSRHSTPKEDITIDGAAAGFYFTSRYWWSSACGDPPISCLTRREIAFRNGISGEIQRMCIGTRIYGYPGRNNHQRNISYHGCPGSQEAEVQSMGISGSDRSRGMAVYRAFPRRHRAAIRRACAREIEAVAHTLSERCQRAARAACQTLSPSRKREVLRRAGVR